MTKLNTNFNGSPQLAKIILDEGISYFQFKKDLKTRKIIILKDLLIIFLMFILVLYISILLNFYSLIVTILFLTVLGTYWFKAYLSFFLEATQFNFYLDNLSKKTSIFNSEDL